MENKPSKSGNILHMGDKQRTKFYIVLNELFYKEGKKWKTFERVHTLKLRWLFLI